MEWFQAKNTSLEFSELAKELDKTNHAFYTRSLMPFVPYEDSSDYELLVAFAPSPTKEEVAMARKLRASPGRSLPCGLHTNLVCSGRSRSLPLESEELLRSLFYLNITFPLFR
jgi:hypothetical protein